eukprot:CAMPEP_0202865120 /NCGR_PEP_ID=MMETSP1391-20130828/5284_1 /ASSEMBLY_ACC=CAM_ASM_000867 /TAXON_ID=1034604 /ORGANISM="Chlamydomonas leiostraca, Strain SAG 11-49" /LENGTH=84 /DNA_ID=CAMNT_0049544921 /DNA_START=51 /DNA_END=305 /DNA_ORIENTATION=+
MSSTNGIGQAPMFRPNPNDSSRFQHPWLKPLPTGRAKTYDLAYKATSALLFAFAAYGMVEIGRGSWYIFKANHMTPSEEKAPSK